MLPYTFTWGGREAGFSVEMCNEKGRHYSPGFILHAGTLGWRD